MGFSLGKIPGFSYGIGGWDQFKLGQWLQQNLNRYFPPSVSAQVIEVQTINVDESITLSVAALTDLKNQLGIS